MNRAAEARALARAPLLTGLPSEDVAALVRLGVRRQLAAGAPLFVEGAPASALYLLLSGRARVTQAAVDGQRVVLHFAHPGDVLGCAILGGARAYPGSAEIVTDAQFLAFEESALRSRIAHCPTLSHNAMRMLTSRVGDLRERLRELSLDSVERRLAHLLVRLARQAEAEQLQPDLPLTRQDLAELVGATQFTVSRIIARWDKEGHIQARRAQLRVCDPVALAAV